MATHKEEYEGDYTLTIEQVIAQKFIDAETPTFELVFEHDEAGELFFVENGIPLDEIPGAMID